MILEGQPDLLSPDASEHHGCGTARPTASRGRRTARPRRHSAAGALLLACALIAPLTVGGTAVAAPTPTIAELRAQLEAQQHEAEVAAERYNAAREQIASVEKRVGAARARQAQQQKQVDAARRAVGLIAAQRYREGDLSALSMLLSDNPDALLAQSGLLATLGDRQVAAIQRLLDAQRQLDADTADVDNQVARLQRTEAEAKAAQAQAKAKANAIQVKINSLTASQRRTIQQASRGKARVGMTCGQVKIDAPNATVQKVINFACAHLGDPYRYGAEGPNSFDCSGFTLRAWQAGGVTLPRTAAEQARVGTRVSVSNLQPGDLIFFYSPISHVGIYIGNDLMIHAPHSGDVVSVADARMSRITAATRP